MADIGPVEYVVIEFPGNQFKGEVAPALGELVDSGTIRILDLVFVKKDVDGAVMVIEYEDLEEAGAFADVEGEAGGLFSDDDARLIGEMLAPDSSAAVLVWEDCWAAPFAAAVRGAGGIVRAGQRIPHDEVVAALADLPPAT
jgi:hypothetical protein